MTNARTRIVQLTIKDTQFLKGIALLLLLVHHCLYTGEGYDDIVIHNRPLFQSIGIFSKLCVAIFVFLSGYGLTMQANKEGGIKNIILFYRKRYVKLIVNFWIIWLLFVPLGLFIFHRTFPEVYGEHYIFRALLDLTGLCTSSSYNATWWFYGCIIVLYALFPLIWKFKSQWFLLLPLAIVLPVLLSHIPILNMVGGYLFVFVCGVVFADNKITFGGGKSMTLLLTILLALFCLYRFIAKSPILWDSAIVIAMASVYSKVSIPAFVSRPLTFLGKHSFNIFLFHTFIYAYYFHDIIFWSRNPVFIVLTLLGVCIIISLFIDQLKKLLRVDTIIQKLTK